MFSVYHERLLSGDSLHCFLLNCFIFIFSKDLLGREREENILIVFGVKREIFNVYMIMRAQVQGGLEERG